MKIYELLGVKVFRKMAFTLYDILAFPLTIKISKEELRKVDSLFLEHTYKIVDKKERGTIITFDDLISNANIEQFKQYREYLEYFQSVNQTIQENEFYSYEQQVDVSMPMEKYKTLKLELKNNK